MTEQELIKGCIRQENLYQKQLFNLFAAKFMTICLRYAPTTADAEDMLQEGFLAIFSSINQFKNNGSFEGWMSRVIVNTCLRYLRSKNVRVDFAEEMTEKVTSIEPYTYETINEKELLKLINALPTGYKLVFNLNIIEGYSHDEIAEILNIQPATSRSQLVKARKMLQQQIIELQKIAV